MTFYYNVIILALQRNMWRQHNTRSMSLTVQWWVNAFLVQVFQRVDSTNHRFRSIETMIREIPTGVWQKFNKEMNTENVREDKDTMPVAWEENQLSRTTKQIWDNLQTSSRSLPTIRAFPTLSQNDTSRVFSYILWCFCTKPSKRKRKPSNFALGFTDPINPASLIRKERSSLLK